MSIGTDLHLDADRDVSGGIGHVRWTICAMLFAATSINYMDRQVLSILKPTLEHSIGMTEVGYGYVVDAFQIAYALGFLVAGRFVDKVGTRIGYIVIMAVWSLSAMAGALANSVLEFAIVRFTLGLGQSGNFPAAIKTVAEWFPQNERSLATGIFNCGTNLGAILAPLYVPWVALHYGWHVAFLVTGVLAAIWIALWLTRYRKPTDHPTLTSIELQHIYQEPARQTEPSVPWGSLLGYRQTWAFALGKFLTDPIWWFYLFWLPSYFSAKFHLNLSHLGLPLVIVYTTSAVHSEWSAVGLLSLAAAAHQGWAANLFTMPSDMFPRSAVGSLIGIGGMAGSVGGALLSTSAGYILQFTHSYSSLFAVAASAYLIAFLVICVLAPGLRKVELEPNL